MNQQIGVRTVIDPSFPLAKLADAFRNEAERKHLGKIGLTVGD